MNRENFDVRFTFHRNTGKGKGYDEGGGGGFILWTLRRDRLLPFEYKYGVFHVHIHFPRIWLSLITYFNYL